MLLFRVILESYSDPRGSRNIKDIDQNVAFRPDSTSGTLSFYSEKYFPDAKSVFEHYSKGRDNRAMQGMLVSKSLPVGVAAISEEECEDLGLSIEIDTEGTLPGTFIGHAQVIFPEKSELSNSEKRKFAQKIRDFMLKCAIERDWQYLT